MMQDNITVERVGNQWLFSDGSILPVVSGGSDIPPSAENNDGNTLADSESLSSDFLKNVAEEDRPFVEKYIKDWDSGVTQRFQKIHDEYKPYKELGDPTTLREARQVMEMLNNDPKAVYDILRADFEEKNPNNTVELPKKIPAEFEGLPPEFVEKFQSQETMLENIAKMVLSEKQSAAEKAEDQALAAEMDRLTKQHGEFDKEYVLTKMYHGASGDDAVKAYQALTQNIINAQSKPKPQPPSILGGGPLPANQKSVTEMTNRETKDLVADMLKRAAES